MSINDGDQYLVRMARSCRSTKKEVVNRKGRSEVQPELTAVLKKRRSLLVHRRSTSSPATVLPIISSFLGVHATDSFFRDLAPNDFHHLALLISPPPATEVPFNSEPQGPVYPRRYPERK
ncbi:hypothetical protein R1flu_002769 [Riccia fluitans]|uniref:Uncharacterized protein n=1 Tax=Riccia fluitans TaxID=41844 RepID=A0ABD1YAV6_9MARC